MPRVAVNPRIPSTAVTLREHFARDSAVIPQAGGWYPLAFLYEAAAEHDLPFLGAHALGQFDRFSQGSARRGQPGLQIRRRLEIQQRLGEGLQLRQR